MGNMGKRGESEENIEELVEGEVSSKEVIMKVNSVRIWIEEKVHGVYQEERVDGSVEEGSEEGGEEDGEGDFQGESKMNGESFKEKPEEDREGWEEEVGNGMNPQ